MFKLFRNEKGQGLTEYALIIFLVAVAAVAVHVALSGGINNVFGSITDTLDG